MLYTVSCILNTVFCPEFTLVVSLAKKGVDYLGVSVSGAAGAEISLTNVPAPRVLETFLWLFVCFLSFCF